MLCFITPPTNTTLNLLRIVITLVIRENALTLDAVVSKTNVIPIKNIYINKKAKITRNKKINNSNDKKKIFIFMDRHH